MNKSTRYIKTVLVSQTDGKYFIDKIQHLITWKDGCSVLDVGCGPGNVTSDFLLPVLPKSGSIVAIDKVAEFISYAKEHYGKSPRVNFVQMDIVCPDPKLDNTFDHAISLYCLHFVAQQEVALRNIYRLLKPGGNFFFTCGVQFNAFETLAAIGNNAEWKPYVADYKSFMSPYQQSENPKADLEKMLLATGFKVSFIVEEPREYNYPINDSKDLFLSSEYIKVPRWLEDEFQNDLLDTFKSLGHLQTENGDEFYCAKWQVLFGHATK